MLGCANQEAPTKLYNEIKRETTNYWIYTQRLTRNKKQHKPFGIPSLYRYTCMFNIRVRVPQYEAELDDFISYH